ncbi:hypothetical protein [Streptomyces flavofungini]|uniref:hypothetical protein n=1 Tax=Streptomyces flavofungini TaxID=68200 RepID=UPI0025B22EC9|nr:hypothetical protein [Streptomyces flavofungini]WJV51683.1 hypothetical protein QUY26_40195 [Streptomyces flavofungini]
MNAIPAQLPFRVEFDAATGQLVVWKIFGNPPRQTTRRTPIPSLEALAAEVAVHRHEAFLQHSLAQTLASAAVKHLGADPQHLEAAVKALSDPTSTVPVSQILRRGTVAPPQSG